ncbi:MAG TPA: VOC family protein [Trueperaceae bacterium]|nr:VOC family protein [Trueperaceae bacterium]
MPVPTRGVHHVSGMSGRPQETIEFYFRVMGLRLVKRTVNYDDPRTYHLYFGDASGHPGSVLTFFPWPGAGPGHPGSGTAEVALRVPRGALPYWRERLAARGAAVETVERLGREVVAFADPDGTRLALVEGDEPPLPAPPPDADPASLLTPTRYFPAAGIAPEHAVLCVDAVTYLAPDVAAAEELLTRLLALAVTARDEDRVRLAPVGAGEDAPRALELVRSPGGVGRLGRGSYHHVAFEVEDEAALEEGKRLVMGAGIATTRVLDRTYFKSVYFAGPGGATVELATRGPGFTVDEPFTELGLALKLPSWLEAERQLIRAQLPVTVSPEYSHLYG